MFDFLKSKEQESESLPSSSIGLDDESPRAEVKTEDDFSDDPVDKIFSLFFGKKEESPMGLKRFGREKFPEQYPAVVDEWADPVATDDSDMKLLRPLLKNTNLEFRGLKLTYSANYDGWSNIAFHKKVDKLGGGLVVCTTTDGLVCGGYNPKAGSVMVRREDQSQRSYLFIRVVSLSYRLNFEKLVDHLLPSRISQRLAPRLELTAW